MAQLRAGPPEVVRRNVLQSGSFAAGSDYVPDNVLRDATAPHFSKSGDGSKDFALAQASSSNPLVQSGLDPCRDGNRAYMATLADQINHSPMPLSHLDVVEVQANQFRSAKATTEQHRQHGVIPLGTHGVSPGMLKHFRALRRAQPIAGTESELFDAFDTTDPSSQ